MDEYFVRRFIEEAGSDLKEVSASDLVKEYQAEGGQEALFAVYEKFYGYIVSFISKSYAPYAGKYREDLLSCCFLGLMEALKKYDPEKSALTTWATPYMRHECEMFIETEVTHRSAYFGKMERGEIKETALGRRVVKMASEEVRPDADESWGVLKDGNAQTEHAAILGTFMSDIRSLVDSLPSDEKLVIVYSFGLGGYEKYSNAKIASLLGISEGKVGYIKHRALKHLKEKGAAL